jgi:hypothetical protein
MTESIALRPQSRGVSFRSTLVAVLVVAAVVAAAVWFTAIRTGGNGSAASANSINVTGPHAATLGGLRATAKALGHPLYWAGPRAKMTYELTVTKGGLAYVRYLPAGAKVGDPRARFVTVGTYPKAHAYSVLTAAKTIKNARVQSFGNGQLAVSYPNRPGSVYVARRYSNLMVEVFAPVSRGAENIVRAGLVVPVG